LFSGLELESTGSQLQLFKKYLKLFANFAVPCLFNLNEGHAYLPTFSIFRPFSPTFSIFERGENGPKIRLII
jgi:hypothetical protein